MSNRARRRHDLERMKAKAVRIHGPRPANIKLANHLAHCAGMCCRNPRTYEGLTLQERRAPTCENPLAVESG